MKIKCPICGTEYGEGSLRFCKICMYSIGTDLYLRDLLNRPSEEDLKVYNDSVEEFRTLWRERNHENKRDISGLVELVEVEGGSFMMGSSEGRGDEKPVHKVTVSSFFMGKYEVTQELWESIMGNNPSEFIGNKRPVESVTWYDAVEFCNKLSEKEGQIPAYKIDKTRKDPNNTYEYEDLKWMVTCDFNANGYRLPTEAEWEYAARGGNSSKGFEYSGSEEIDEVA